MDILTEHRDGEITVFTNNSTPEIHLTTRRAEAKEEVAENMGAVTTVADNMEDVKGAAKYAQTFDDVLLNLPTIIKAMPAAETAVQAKDDAIVAKESAQESAEKAESAVARAEEVTADQVELAKGYAEQAKTEVSKVSSAFKIVGTVPTVEDLPKNAEVGNIYLVGDNSITNKPEYVWTSGGTWEKFGETVDLSAYQTKEEAETALAEKQDTLTAGEGIKIEGNVISTTGGGGSAEIPDNVYTAENLVAGDNIAFNHKEAAVNADIVGSPVISDNYEVSGFSDSNHLKFVEPIASASKYDSFEIGFAFKANTLNTDGAGIYDGGISGPGYRITLTLDGKIRIRIVTTSSGSYGVDITGATTLATNKKYYAKVNYSSETGYTLSLKEEGGEWVVDASSTTTTKPYPNEQRDVLLGDNKSTGNSFDGTIYLPEMYINIDGKRVWTGLLPDRTAISTENVYTKTNLLGGKDIEIVPEPVEGGIDEHTLGVFTFENSLNANSVENGESLTTESASLVTSNAKFGAKSMSAYGGAQKITKTGLSVNSDWTVDNWAFFNNTSGKDSLGIGNSYTSSNYTWLVYFSANNQKVYIKNPSGTTVASSDITIPLKQWIHLAAEKHGTTINGYLDGVKVVSYTDASVVNSSSSALRCLMSCPYDTIDELRFSNIARYQGEDFTPPTKAYEVAEPTGNMVVNYTGEGLSGKADTDLANTNPSASFKEMSIGWGRVDYSTFTTIAASTNFEAPSAGVISCVPSTNTDTSSVISVSGNGYISIAGKTVIQTTYAHGSDSGHVDGGFFPIDKGEPVFHTMNHGTVYFYPLKGV